MIVRMQRCECYKNNGMSCGRIIIWGHPDQSIRYFAPHQNYEAEGLHEKIIDDLWDIVGEGGIEL